MKCMPVEKSVFISVRRHFFWIPGMAKKGSMRTGPALQQVYELGKPL